MKRLHWTMKLTAKRLSETEGQGIFKRFLTSGQNSEKGPRICHSMSLQQRLHSFRAEKQVMTYNIITGVIRNLVYLEIFMLLVEL